jgi:hypothetical protein
MCVPATASAEAVSIRGGGGAHAKGRGEDLGRRWRRDDGESGGTLPSNLTVAAACRYHRLVANARRHCSLARSGLLSLCAISTGSYWSKPFQEWKEVLHFWVQAITGWRTVFHVLEPSLGMDHPIEQSNEQSLEIALENT